jgi:plastocyanin
LTFLPNIFEGVDKVVKRVLAVALAGLIIVGLAPGLHTHAAAGRNLAPHTIPPEHTVLIGAGQLEVSQGSWLGFTPKYLDITAGDAVLFKDVDALEPHTVSFGPMAMLKDLAGKDQFMPIPQKSGPPALAINSKVALPTKGTTYDGTGYANSGILQDGKSWTLTFTTPGTYEYICLVHGAIMNGYVIVHAAQPQGKMYIVQAGDGQKSSADQNNATVFDGFYPLALTVHVGDTVEWIGGFHTISFGPAALIKQLMANLFVPMPQKSGPPVLLFNPKIAFPSGGHTYDGTGFVNSGVLALLAPPGSTAPPSFKLTFTKAGTYTYYCLIHPGMDGTITVTP